MFSNIIADQQWSFCYWAAAEKLAAEQQNLQC